MAHLEARKDMLEAQLAQGEDAKVSVHPSMATVYRERVANLREALAKEGCQAEAAEIMRTLIDKIVLTPVCRDGKETLSITLHGDLAGILGLATKAKGPLDESGPVVECTKLVAGACNHLYRTATLGRAVPKSLQPPARSLPGWLLRVRLPPECLQGVSGQRS